MKRGVVRRYEFTAGDFGDGPGTMRATYRPGILPLGNPVSLEIFFQMGNDIIPWLGVENAPRLGIFHQLLKERQVEVAKVYVVAGLLVFIGLYYLYLFRLRSSSRASLYFACFALTAVCRVLIMSRLVSILLPDVDHFDFLLRAELASGSIIGCFFILYLREVIPDHVNAVAARLFLLSLVLHLIILLFSPLYFAYDGLLQGQQSLALGVVVLLIWSVLKALHEKPSVAVKVLGLGVVALCGAVINDVLFSQALIESTHLIPFGVAALALCQGL